MGKQVLLLGASLCISLVLLEVSFALWWHNPYQGEAVDHILKIQRQHAGLDHRVDRTAIGADLGRVRFRTDDRGYILPSSQFEDPDFRIVFLGGSTTECVAVREDLRFHGLVSQHLADRGFRVNTFNAGKSGNTVHDSLNVLLNHVAVDAPDVVVLMHATNDIGVLSRAGSYGPRMGGLVGPVEFAKWLIQAGSSRSALFGGVRNLLSGAGTLDPDDDRPEKVLGDRVSEAQQYRSRLRAFVHVARDLEARPVLMTQPLSSSTTELTPDWADAKAQDLFNAIVRRVAVEEEVALVDLVREVQERDPDWDAPGRLLYDGMHVTDRGSQVYAEIISEAMAGMLSGSM